MTDKKLQGALTFFLCLACIVVASPSLIGNASASELVYKPVNPNFGGNPFGGGFLQGNAASQDQFANAPAPLPDFSGLERALIRLGEQTPAAPATPDTTTPAN